MKTFQFSILIVEINPFPPVLTFYFSRDLGQLQTVLKVTYRSRKAHIVSLLTQVLEELRIHAQVAGLHAKAKSLKLLIDVFLR